MSGPQKRKNEDIDMEDNSVKRIRTENSLVEFSEAPIVEFEEKRTSNLSSPTMLLVGHKAAIYTMKFSPDGQCIASGSFDKSILLWNVYGECENYNVLQGHKNAILDLCWNSSGTHIFTACADKTVGIWDAYKGNLIKKLKGHKGVVNSVCVTRRGETQIVSGSDDGCICIWDPRMRNPVATLDNEHVVTAVCFSDDGNEVISGGIDNVIKVWDLRKQDFIMTLEGHRDTITSLSLSPDGTHVLSNSMDNTLRSWDIRPFVSGSRCTKIFEGVRHGVEKNLLKCNWSADGEMITAGSSDRIVRIWDVPSCQELYALPGHDACVNEVIFHPNEPIIGSCGNDKKIFIGELER